jgi:hypothetical protein
VSDSALFPEQKGFGLGTVHVASNSTTQQPPERPTGAWDEANAHALVASKRVCRCVSIGTFDSHNQIMAAAVLRSRADRMRGHNQPTGIYAECTAMGDDQVRWILLSLVGLLIAPAVDADWEYTRWGMTPEQVVAVSGGKAK